MPVPAPEAAWPQLDDEANGIRMAPTAKTLSPGKRNHSQIATGFNESRSA
jgi:hypothetical protein